MVHARQRAAATTIISVRTSFIGYAPNSMFGLNSFDKGEESPKSQVGAPLVRTTFFDESGNPLMLILKASFVWLQQVIDLGGQHLQVLISLRVMR
jgi:hypothetical protein